MCWLPCRQRLMEHGIGFMEKGNYPLALEAFEAAATLEPSFAEVGRGGGGWMGWWVGV